MAKDPKDTVDELNDSFASLRDSIREISEELFIKINKISDAKKEYNSLLNIAKQFQDNEEDISKLGDKQIKNLRSKSESSLRDLKNAAQRLAKEKGIVDITHTNLKFRKDLTDQELTLLSALKENFAVEEQLIKQIQQEDQLRDKINKKVGVTGVLLKGMSKIPIVGELLKTEEALEAARKKAKETGSSFAAMGAGLGNMGKNLISSLADPLVSIGLLVKGFKMFLDIGFKADTEITNLSKSMASSKEEATATRDRFIEIQNSGENIFYNTKNLVAAQLELADAFGVTRGFSEQQVKDQVVLTQQMGLQADEAAGIQQLAMSNGMTAEQVTDSVIKQTAALSKQKGIQLDNKKIIGEVAKVSGQLRLQYANNPKLIAAAVVQTKQLGLSLDQAAKAANSLLDFESSIESELSAELLTGKSLNLERARGLALNGDAAGAAAEMAKQVGSAADFTNMNVIQQEALAKAVGMSADELANSLITQENLAKLGSETRKQLEEKAEALRAEGKMDEANRLLASAGDEEQAQAALERVDAQATFNQSIETLKSMLSSIVEGPAADFVAWFGDAEKGADRLKGLFESIKTTISIVAGIIAGRMVFGLATSVGSMIAQVALSKKLKAAAQEQALAEGVVTALKVTGAEASTLGAATPLIIGGLAAVMAGVGAYAMMNDGVINPKGGMVVSGPEGSIQLNKKDSIIAGTNLGGDGGKSSGNSSSSELRELRNMISAIANRPINVAIDGKKVIEATTGNQPNTQGGESRKNSYRIS
jgi:hypothetical protein